MPPLEPSFDCPIAAAEAAGSAGYVCRVILINDEIVMTSFMTQSECQAIYAEAGK